MLLGILLTFLIIVCVILIAVILMQRSEGGALGMGGGGGGFLSTRGTGDLLTRTTQWLGFVFFVLCLAITVVSGRTAGTSLIDRAKVGKIDAGLLKKQAAPPPPTQQEPFQAPSPTFGAPATPAPSQTFPVAPPPSAPVPSVPAR